MSTDTKALRFFRGKTHPMMSSVHLRQDDRRISGHVREIAERSLEPGETAYEATPATEMDLLRALVKAANDLNDEHQEQCPAAFYPFEPCDCSIAGLHAARDALLAVAPHWKGE